jgi:hypothetical protein
MCVSQQEVDHPLLGKVTEISQWLVDSQTGFAPTDEEVHAHFRNLTATGIMVKRRFDPSTHVPAQPIDITTPLPYILPYYATIDGITPTHVLLLPPRTRVRFEDDAPHDTTMQLVHIPRSEFHNLYEID